MNPIELQQLEDLLDKFSRVYKTQYPISAQDAEELSNIVNYIREGDEE